MTNNQLHFDVLKFIDSEDEVRGEEIIKKFANKAKEPVLSGIVSKLIYQKFVQGNLGLGFSKGSYSILSEGKFKLLEIAQFDLSKRNFWLALATAILMALISIGGIVWDSTSDKIWQKEQIELLQQQNELLQDLVRNPLVQ